MSKIDRTGDQPGVSLPITNVQTGSGTFTLTDTAVSLERPGFPRAKTQTLFRSALVGVDYRILNKPSFLSKGIVLVTFHAQGGERMEVRMLYPLATAVLTQFGQSLP